MAGTDATPTGAQSRDGGFVDESKDRPLTPREEALAAIKATRLEQFNDELVEAGGQAVDFNNGARPDEVIEPDDPVEAPPPPRARAAPKPADPPTAADDQLSRQLADEDPKRMVKVKVDGEEIEVPYETVVANYQKISAADKRLRDATADADRIRAEARAAAPPAAPGPSPAPGPAPSGKKWTEALFEGDEDAADAAIQKRIDDAIAAKVGAGTASPDLERQISERVQQEVAAERQRDRFDTVLQQSQARYPGLYSDPDIQGLAKSKIERRMDEGVPFDQALSAVETELATKFNWKPAGTPAPAPGNRVRERQERKSGIASMPLASARRADEPDAEPIMDENQRAARGIAQLMAGRPGQQQA